MFDLRLSVLLSGALLFSCCTHKANVFNITLLSIKMIISLFLLSHPSSSFFFFFFPVEPEI